MKRRIEGAQHYSNYSEPHLLQNLEREVSSNCFSILKQVEMFLAVEVQDKFAPKWGQKYRILSYSGKSTF